MTDGVTHKQYLADFSLALVSRSADYQASRLIVDELPHHFSAVRYWRVLSGREPTGIYQSILRRAMLAEMFQMPFAKPRHRQRFADLPTLYLDPLHALYSEVLPQDIVLCHDLTPIGSLRPLAPRLGKAYASAYKLICGSRPGIVFTSDDTMGEFTRSFGHGFRFMTVNALPGGEPPMRRRSAACCANGTGTVRKTDPHWRKQYIDTWATLLANG